VFVVDASWSGEWLPAQLPPGVFGRVTERVGDVLQPVAGARVMLYDGSVDSPSITNTNGFYSICSAMGADFSVPVTARKEGYRPATATILWGWDLFVDFTLDRVGNS
jgi:hypothetical protein